MLLYYAGFRISMYVDTYSPVVHLREATHINHRAATSQPNIDILGQGQPRTLAVLHCNLLLRLVN